MRVPKYVNLSEHLYILQQHLKETLVEPTNLQFLLVIPLNCFIERKKTLLHVRIRWAVEQWNKKKINSKTKKTIQWIMMMSPDAFHMRTFSQQKKRKMKRIKLKKEKNGKWFCMHVTTYENTHTQRRTATKRKLLNIISITGGN